jgi:transcription antitermination factor NusG
MSWFAVKVWTRSELAVDVALRAKCYETFLPTYKESRKWSDRVKTLDTPLFPGYVFCRFIPMHPLPIVTTKGVEYVVGIGRTPCQIEESEITSLQRIVSGGASVAPWPYLREGDRVRVQCGAFTGAEGILITSKGGDRLVITVEVLKRSCSLQIDRTWIRPLT